MSAWLPAVCGFAVGAAVGFAVRHAKLCSFGAIEDALIGGDGRRLRAFGLALGLAILGTQSLVLAGVLDPQTTTYVPQALPIVDCPQSKGLANWCPSTIWKPPSIWSARTLPDRSPACSVRPRSRGGSTARP